MAEIIKHYNSLTNAQYEALQRKKNPQRKRLESFKAVSRLICNDSKNFYKNKHNRRKLIEKYKKCNYCGSVDDLTIDHIIPRSKGGSHRMDNLQVLCRRCNTEKADKILTIECEE